jgi:hypothetical protein
MRSSRRSEERGGVLSQSCAGSACRKCDGGASAVGIRVLRLEMGAVSEGRYVELPRGRCEWFRESCGCRELGL